MDTKRLNSIKEQCIKRWGQADRKIKEFQDNFDKWCLFSTDEETQICLELLEKFDYYSKQKVNEELKAMHKQLLKIFKLDPEYTIYTILKHQRGRVNSSMEYFSEYVNLNKIDKECRIVDIYSIKEEEYKNIENIVMIDDCIGSGQTTRDFLEQNKEKLIDKKIYLILIHLVIESANELVDFAQENGYDLTILCRNRKNKAFAEDGNMEQKEKFIALSKNRKILSQYILGKSGVEALMAFYNNTPNNTLGIFWCESEKNIPLFPRIRSKKPKWMLQESKERRKQQNYRNAGRNL